MEHTGRDGVRTLVRVVRRVRARAGSLGAGEVRRPTRRVVVSTSLTLAICLTAGFMIGTGASVSHGTDLRGRNTDLISMVRTESQRNAALAQQVSSVRAEVDALSSREAGAAVSQTTLDRAAMDAQITAVKGPGVTVVLDDAPSSVTPPDVDPDLLVVHQQDIQAVVNALWEGGAEAMTIQGQRVVSTTGIKCVGNTVVLQGIPYAPPYRIQAIGDQNALEAALLSSKYVRNYQDYVAAYGLGYQQQRDDALSFPAFAGAIAMQYAKPAR